MFPPRVSVLFVFQHLQGSDDLVPRRLRSAIQQGLGGDDEAGCADAALQGGMIQELLLDGMQAFGRGNALDSEYGLAFCLDRQHQAGVDQHAVQDDAAGAAVAVVAALFSAG